MADSPTSPLSSSSSSSSPSTLSTSISLPLSSSTLLNPVPLPSTFTLNPPLTNLTTTPTSTTKPATTPHRPGAPPFDPNEQRESSLLNYYFVFLALLIAFVGLAIWIVHRRKKRRKQRLLARGQHALARDLEGWTSRRRWYRGGWRIGEVTPRSQAEGLNELGEAPPPYTSSEGGAEEGGRPGTVERREEVELVERPRALHARGGSLPPDYATSTASRSTVGINRGG
ncbi:hypothetical protein P152DRAFT_458592 [Eremomyces bilateralis CBS 781.70]|uniref:Uncharacterized protein n=1 Tax=Eremomyces bilateralis CBS 781.70 TaxID=1392243 RepID=A0A6G1G250_9PEZI|nr:uncharacterized protein P152DRAFT_458592 [Eremomyces bilateralis CBS 781.70]KAF1812187.1 hypothetical protein P152DRAFT_458592 [Eremomyces bilateralis CBS 781.70]